MVKQKRHIKIERMTRVAYEAVLYSTKQTRQMAITKFMIELLQWLGIPMLGVSLFADFDTVKAAVAFVAGFIMLVISFCFRVDGWLYKRRIQRKRDAMQLEREELELIERRRAIRLSRPAGEEEEN